MKQVLFIVMAVIITIGARAQTTWTVDNVHSKVKFSVSHLIVSEVEGSFKVYSGKLQFSKSDFSDAHVEFSVDVNSINTDNERRDQHLQSDDFFNAEKYPQMTFESTSWKKVGDQSYILEGDLTIRNVTKRVAFTVVYGGTINDPWGNARAGFKATTVINRFDYSLKFNALTEAGSAVVGKDVSIMLNLEFVKEKS